MAQRGTSTALYVISVAAELAGVHPQTLRIYERKGLVDPARTGGGSRRYSEDDIDRLRRIQDLTNEGLNLAGVKRVIALEDELARLRAELADGAGGGPGRRGRGDPPPPPRARAPLPGPRAVGDDLPPASATSPNFVALATWGVAGATKFAQWWWAWWAASTSRPKSPAGSRHTEWAWFASARDVVVLDEQVGALHAVPVGRPRLGGAGPGEVQAVEAGPGEGGLLLRRQLVGQAADVETQQAVEEPSLVVAHRHRGQALGLGPCSGPPPGAPA